MFAPSPVGSAPIQTQSGGIASDGGESSGTKAQLTTMSQVNRPRSTTIPMKRYLRLSLLVAVCAALLALAPVRHAGAAPGERTWDAWDQATGANGSEYIADTQGRALQLRGVNIKTGEPRVSRTVICGSPYAARALSR